MQTLNLNADVGEGFGSDEMLMPYLSYCNIACGGHIGNLETIEKTITLAQKYQVKIGAHLSYPDPENFGRKSISISSIDFKQAIKNQLQLFDEACQDTQSQIYHIKAHGALYHDIVDKPGIREDFIDCLHSELENDFILFLPAHIAGKWENPHNWNILYEAFADRQYDTNLKLLSRQKEGAVLVTAEDISSQIIKLYHNQKVFTSDGSWKEIACDTICIHGDHPNIENYFPEVIKILTSRNLLK